MALDASSFGNILLKQYNSQVTNKNVSDAVNGDKSDNVSQEKVMQEMVFQVMLSEMMESMGNSAMAETLLDSLSGNEALTLDNSLSTSSNFNSNVRGAAQLLSQNYSNGNSIVSSNNSLGFRAAKYESNLNPGEISNTPGDYGGKSYGAWQFSSKTGSLDSFINSLKDKNIELYSKFSAAKAMDGNTFGRNFDAAWTSTALSNKSGFLSLQQSYVKENFYDKAAQAIKSRTGVDINTKSDAVKESLWSTAVQHGVGGATSIFSKLNLNNSDANIINDLYNERQKVNIYFRDSSAPIKQSVYNRFTREKQDMLNMLSGELA